MAEFDPDAYLQNKSGFDPDAYLGQASNSQNGFSDMAASMDPTDLSVARSKNNAFGDYLRSEAMAVRNGESLDQRNLRLGGKITDQNAGPVDALEGTTRAYVQGGLFGGGDELVAGGAAALDALTGAAPYSEAYDIRLARERAKLNEFRATNPALAYGSEIVGSIPTSIMLPGFKQAQSAGLAARAGMGSVEGAAQGFLYGGLAADKNRLSGGAMGAGFGGGIGALAPVVSSGARNLYDRYATARAARSVGLSRPAYEIIKDVSQADDSLTGAGADRLRSAGPSAMLADAGPSQSGLLDVAVQRTGAASRVATERVEQRVTDASDRLNKALDDTLGAPQGIRQSSRDIAQNTSAARDDAYKAAYAQPINYADDTGRAIEGVLDRVPDRIKKEAIQDANDLMVAAGERNNQIKINVADDGSMIFSEMPNVMQLDYIKRALGTMAESAKGEYGKATDKSMMLSELARSLKVSMSDAVPIYADAVKLGGDKIQRDNALRLGANLLRSNTTREMVGEVAADLSDEARHAAFSGLRGSIDDALATVKRSITDGNVDAKEAVKLIKDMSSRANREKVTMLVGEGPAQRLFSQINEAAMAFDLRAGVAQNSKTFARTAINQSVEDSVGSGPVAALRDADPVKSAKTMIQALIGGGPEAKKRVTDSVVFELADILTAPNPMQRLQILRNAPGRVQSEVDLVGNITEQIMRKNAPVSGQLSKEENVPLSVTINRKNMQNALGAN
jgi:hypothetical protein